MSRDEDEILASFSQGTEMVQYSYHDPSSILPILADEFPSIRSEDLRQSQLVPAGVGDLLAEKSIFPLVRGTSTVLDAPATG